VHIEGLLAFERRIDGTPQLLGQEGQGFALAVLGRQCGQVLLACRIVSEKEHRRCREGPLAIGVAPLGACGPVAFARRFAGTLDEAAIGEEILDAGETPDVVALIQQDKAQDFPKPGTVWSRYRGLASCCFAALTLCSSRALSNRS
jgi:hypothetical protein